MSARHFEAQAQKKPPRMGRGGLLIYSRTLRAFEVFKRYAGSLGLSLRCMFRAVLKVGTAFCLQRGRPATGRGVMVGVPHATQRSGYAGSLARNGTRHTQPSRSYPALVLDRPEMLTVTH